MSARVRRMAAIPLVVPIALALAACVTAVDPGAPKTPAASIPSESQAAQHCQTWNLQGTPVTPSIEQLSKLAPTVVVATFTGYGNPFWDTPDGKGAPQQVVQQGNAEILTNVRLDVNGEVKGPRAVADHVVVWGGTIGCDVFTSAQNPDLSPGSKYVMFLLPRTKGGAATGDAWLVAAWQVGSSDDVMAPVDGPRSLGVLMKEIRAGKPESTLEPGAEPTSGYP